MSQLGGLSAQGQALLISAGVACELVVSWRMTAGGGLTHMAGGQLAAVWGNDTTGSHVSHPPAG